MKIVDPAGLNPVEVCVMRIRAAYARSVESIIEIGRELIAAKQTLRHGDFERMCRARLPFKERTAQMYMKIARHPTLSSPQVWARLPASVATLDFLAGLDDAVLDLALRNEGIRPDQSELEVRMAIDLISARVRLPCRRETPAAPARSVKVVILPRRATSQSDVFECAVGKGQRIEGAKPDTITDPEARSGQRQSETIFSFSSSRANDVRSFATDAVALIEKQLQRNVVDIEGSLQILARWKRLTASTS